MSEGSESQSGPSDEGAGSEIRPTGVPAGPVSETPLTTIAGPGPFLSSGRGPAEASFQVGTFTYSNESVVHSPFIPAAELARFEKVQPGFSKEYLDEWKKDKEHHRDMDRQGLVAFKENQKLEYRDRLTGQLCALFIALATVAGGVWVAVSGHPGWGTFLGVGGVGGIVYTFVMGRKLGRNDEPPNEDDEGTANQPSPPSRPVLPTSSD